MACRNIRLILFRRNVNLIKQSRMWSAYGQQSRTLIQVAAIIRCRGWRGEGLKLICAPPDNTGWNTEGTEGRDYHPLNPGHRISYANMLGSSDIGNLPRNLGAITKTCACVQPLGAEEKRVSRTLFVIWWTFFFHTLKLLPVLEQSVLSDGVSTCPPYYRIIPANLLSNIQSCGPNISYLTLP